MKKSPFSCTVLGFILIFVAAFSAPAFSDTDEGQVTAAWAVWSCWYWPWVNNLSPNLYDPNQAMAKYDRYDPNAFAQDWEFTYHGPPQNPASWWGHCHAWSAASCWEAQPKGARTLNGIKFTVRDRKGLTTEAYYRCADGSNYEIYVSKPSPGLFWKWLRREIKGRNSMHGHAMAFIGELYYGPAEIWNYPIYKYNVTYSGNPGTGLSGTMTIYVAADADPSYANKLGLFYQTFTYQFSGVKFNNAGEPIAGGKWIGSGPYHRPDAIWRPYYPTYWTTYAGNTQLDESHLGKILNP